jgi:hypothetical protein
MPFDLLSSLTRLEARLRKKRSQQTRHPRRRLAFVVLAPVLSLAGYVGVARWFLSGVTLRALINTHPESLALDYDSATSLWRGRLAIRNLRIRGNDHNVQWIVRLTDARIDYSVLALLRRTFRAERVRGTGLSFSIRNKLDAAEAKNTDLSALPPIPGFADPPLRTPEVQGAKAVGNPWRVEVRNIRIERFDDIWFDACHYRGTAHLDGAFFLRPGLLVWIGPAHVGIEAGELRIGRAAAGLSVSGSIDGTFEPFEPPKVHGSEIWQKASGKVQLDAGFDRLEVLEHLFSSDGTRLEGGAGKATFRAAVEQGMARGELHLAVHDGSVQLEKLGLQGDTDLRLVIPAWNLMSGPLEISGSRVAFSDVRASGSDDSWRWWGRFDIRSGKIGSTAFARIDAETRDARPLLALLAADLPAWTRGLLSLDDLSATGTISLGPSLTRVEGLDARGGSFHIQGRYLRDKKTRDGAFLIESGSLSVGLELQPAATKLRLLAAKKWYEEQRDARSGVPPPAGDHKRVRIEPAASRLSSVRP